MALQLPVPRLVELWRYYQVGILNTAFGLGAYSLFVWLGMNMFVAQLFSHSLGVAFNYITYSRHVFSSSEPAKLRFVASYVGNYVVGLVTLSLVSLLVESPYLAGFIAALLVSIINYFVLSKYVFNRKAS